MRTDAFHPHSHAGRPWGPEDAAARIAQSQMRRDGTARAVLWLLAVTGVVVSAIVAKQATVARQSAFASPPMLDVRAISLPSRASMSPAERESQTGVQRSQGAALQTRDGTHEHAAFAVVWPERLSAESPDFVGPRFVRQAGDAVAVLTTAAPITTTPTKQDDLVLEENVRWFHGRPVRPSRVLWMRVTAYSPDERSCPGTADGFTATMHCVTTNNGLLVAADPAVLPMGSMLSVPGYGTLASGEEAIVPVLDVGGAIKGERLDLLFPTHEAALRWGVRELPVVIWQYADGKPFANPRQAR